MHILLVASAFNSLTQRVLAELQDRGHTVGVTLALGNDDALRDAVQRHAPQLIVAPMLTTAIPEDVWAAHTDGRHKFHGINDRIEAAGFRIPRGKRLGQS